MVEEARLVLVEATLALTGFGSPRTRRSVPGGRSSSAARSNPLLVGRSTCTLVDLEDTAAAAAPASGGKNTLDVTALEMAPTAGKESYSYLERRAEISTSDILYVNPKYLIVSLECQHKIVTSCHVNASCTEIIRKVRQKPPGSLFQCPNCAPSNRFVS